MEDPPPPADHVLRPHHIALLSILMTAFKDHEVKKFPAPFALHIYRVLLNEISEISQPKTHEELLLEVCTGPSADADECAEFKIVIRSIHEDLDKIDKMANFFGNVPGLFVVKNIEVQPRLIPRSIFGYFCRRCFITFTKLSFIGLNKLCEDYAAWCAGDSSAGYDIVHKEDLYSNLLMFKTQGDRTSWAKPIFYEKWEKHTAIGDENVAVESLRQFFEQHFHESHDSGYRPHALLNLVRMHYIEGEYVAARQFLSEAIVTARTIGDRITLHHCTSLMNRLPNENPGQRPILHAIQADIHPLEILFDVSKLMDEENDQPLSAAFHKIFQAVGLFDHWLDVQFALPSENQEWASHSVQSMVWREAGCDKLAALEENIVITFMEPGTDNNNRLAIILNKAYKQARQGKYTEALALLIDPSTWCGLILHDYGQWAYQIWRILTLRATRRGQFRLYRELLLPRRPDAAFNEKEYLFNVDGDKMSTIRESLYQTLQLRQLDQVTSGTEYLLQAIWHSEFLGRFNLYRTCIILLADIGLEFGMSKRSRRILEEILPQVINGEELEQRAVACFTLARCIIVAGESESTSDALQEALPYLLVAESDFLTLEMYQSLKDVQYMLSVVYHNLDLQDERQKAAQRHADSENKHQELERQVSDEEIHRMFELVATVGDALATRR
ncbi:hypothetical protein BDN70DRAFT_912885 [Pholiota conissans]|uniref:Anaphase-promoting complex subunit 5 n=1 Tax=Pholiota conissans TaxID=109636 RepID=A0A9P5Z3S1_9AGAR|nr:hypothetical protein BDN70DRAFT_912885 [Pholiota conissans]